MIWYDDVTKENTEKHSSSWLEIPNLPYRILVIGGSRLGTTNALLNLINHKLYADKIYVYTKDAYEAKYQFLINKCKRAGLKHCNDSETFIEYSNDMNDIYKNIEEYHPNKERKILIVFDNMIADMLSNKKLNPIVTEPCIRGRKKHFTCFYHMLFCSTKKHQNSTHYFVMKIPNQQKLERITY